MSKQRLISLIAINKIEPNDYNPNEMTEAEFKECKNEIEHLGALPKPIIVRKLNSKFIIVDGEHNWRAAKELGFITVPCEIIQVDNIEAMRQTYKRNMHGTFNPVKLGEMFKRVGDGKADTSLRKLAKEYDISEGTVRNALTYVKAQELRNSYARPENEKEPVAIKDLSIRQVRLYIALPSTIRDKWLLAGADITFLLTKRELRSWNKETGKSFEDLNWEEYEKMAGGSTADMVRSFHDIYKAGLADKIKANKWEFQRSVEKAAEFYSWEYWKFHHGDAGLRDKVRPYTIHYYDLGEDKMMKESVRHDFERLYRLIHLDGEFRITPEEFAKIFDDSKHAGCEPGYAYTYPQRAYLEKAIQVLLIEKGVLTELADVDNLPDPGKKLMEIELEKSAPEYIKQAKLPTELKARIFNYEPQGDYWRTYGPINNAALEQVKKEVIAFYEAKSKADGPRSFLPSGKNLEEELRDRLEETLYRRSIDAMTNEDIAVKIMSLTKLYETEKEGSRSAEFRIGLLHLNRNELLAIYKIMDYMDHVKAMRQAFGKERN